MNMRSDKIVREIRPAETLPNSEFSPDRRTELAEGLAFQFEELGDAFGAETLREVIRAMHDHAKCGEVVGRNELAKMLEGKATRQEFQKAALGYMEKDEFVRHREDGVLVVDAEKLLSEFSLRKYRHQETGFTRKKHIQPRQIAGIETFGRNKVEFLANAFAGMNVVLEGQDGEISKSLFYLPKTRAEAMDVKEIRAADFHFGLWEIPGASQAISIHDSQEPLALGDLKFLEATVAALLYHPRYGGAERKGRDRLVVKDADGKDTLFSGAWLARQGLFVGKRCWTLGVDTECPTLAGRPKNRLAAG
jgi:hypothetical protein